MFLLLNSTLLICPPPSDFTVLEDAEIESSPVATSALTVRHSNHLARPQSYLLKNFLLVNFLKFLATQTPRSGSESEISESEYETPFWDHFSILQKAQSTYSKWLEYFPWVSKVNLLEYRVECVPALFVADDGHIALQEVPTGSSLCLSKTLDMK